MDKTIIDVGVKYGLLTVIKEVSQVGYTRQTIKELNNAIK
jgi:hypothetical protein